MISAMTMPNTASSETVTTVKNNVMPSAGQKSVASTPGGQSPTVPAGLMQRFWIQYK